MYFAPRQINEALDSKCSNPAWGRGGRGVMGDEERGAKHADKELRVQSNAGRLEPRPL